MTDPVIPPGTASNRARGLRRLVAEYWQPAIGIAAGLYGTLATLGLEGVLGRIFPDSPAGKVTAVLLAVTVLLVIRHPSVAFRVVRILVPPERLPEDRRGFRGLLPYTRGERLPGRAQDIELCRALVRSGRFIVLDGEVGCGKSSILAAALVPEIESFTRLVELRPGSDPFCALFRAIAPHAEPPRQIRREQLLSLLQTGDEQGAFATPFIAIDQFEELFVLVPERTRQRFAATIREIVKGEHARVLVVIRSDFLDLLVRLLADVDPHRTTLDLPAWYTLKAFSEELASEVVEEILADIAGEDAVHEHEVRALARTLAHELRRPPRDTRLSPDDAATILPVELQCIGLTLQLGGMRNLSVEGYRRAHRRAGLMRVFLEDVKRFVYFTCGIDGETTLLVMREFVSATGTRRPRTFEELATAPLLCERVSVARLHLLLQALEQRFVVRRTVPQSDASGRGAVQYELIHDYLAHLLSDAPDPFLRKARDAGERLHFWLTRTQGVQARRSAVARLFSQPIPLTETLRLRRFASNDEAKRMLAANLKGFASRIGVFALVAALTGGSAWAWWSSDRHQSDLAADAGTEAVMQIAPWDRTGSTMEWMVALGQVGRIREAIRVSRVVDEPDERTSLLYETAASLAKDGFAPAAAALLRAALAGEYDSAALTSTATALTQRGQAQEAAMLPASAATLPARATAYADVAVVLANAGYDTLGTAALRTALATSTRVGNATVRAELLARVVLAAARVGQRAEAHAAAAQLWTVLALVPRDDVFVAMPIAATALARAAQPVRARQAMRAVLSLQDLPYGPGAHLESAFFELASTGETGWLLAALRTPTVDARFRVAAAMGLARAGQVDSALAITAMMGDEAQGLGTLIGIGRFVGGELRDSARARSILASAAQLATRARESRDGSPSSSDMHLQRLVRELFYLGDRTRAIEISRDLPHDQHGSKSALLLEEFSKSYARMGAADSALNLIRLIPNDVRRCDAAINVAKQLALHGNRRVVLTALQNCKLSWGNRSYAGSTAVVAAVVAGVLPGSPVLDSIANFSSNWFFPPTSDSVFALAVGDLGNQGRFPAARGLLWRIREDPFRTQARASLAEALARADSGAAALDLIRGIDHDRFPKETSRSCGEIAAWQARTGHLWQARLRAGSCAWPNDALRGYQAILHFRAASQRRR